MNGAAKQPNATDIRVGHRVRLRRLELKWSQGKLAAILGLTFQQVQKYEKGSNRISSSRLDQIAKALAVPVAFFFPDHPAHSDETQQIAEFLNTANSLRLQRAFAAIPDAEIKRCLVTLAEAFAKAARPKQAH